MPLGIVNKTDLRKSIKEIFRLKDDTYIDDYATIAEFLQQPAAMATALVELEKDMIAKFSQSADPTLVNAVRGASANRITARSTTAVAKDPKDATQRASYGRNADFKQKYHGCLAKALLVLEQTNQFSLGFAKSTLPIAITKTERINADLNKHLDKEKGVPVLTGVVRAGHFNSFLLANGTHWKDPGVSPDHGEFTHRIQWYAICKAGLKLTHQPIDLFKKLSTPECFFYASKADEEADRNDRSMWYFLFDCADGAVNPTYVSFETATPWKPTTDNFRSPEYFNRWMIMDMTASTQFPFLSQYLADRYHKRDSAGTKAVQEMLDSEYSDKYGTKISTHKVGTGLPKV
jgi:hypothetical protein